MEAGGSGTHVDDGLKLLLGRHLLGKVCGLNAVEDPFEPADELDLSDTQLGFGVRTVVERQGHSLELVDQLRRQTILLQLPDPAAADLGEAEATCSVQGHWAHLLDQLVTIGPDMHDPGRLLDLVRVRLSILPAARPIRSASGEGRRVWLGRPSGPLPPVRFDETGGTSRSDFWCGRISRAPSFLTLIDGDWQPAASTKVYPLGYAVQDERSQT